MTDSLLLRRPALSRHLGPVVAASRRLASRYANSLRAGSPGEVEELRSCGLILVQPGGEGADRVLDLLRRSAPWKGSHFALLSAESDSSALGELREGGALVCSVAAIPSRARDVVILEGDRRAVRRARQWLAEARLRCLELSPGGKPLVLLGLLTASSLLTPLLDSALMTLRAAGIGSREARRLLHDAAEAAVRAFLARGRQSWENPGAPRRAELAVRCFENAIRAVPALAEFQKEIFEAVQRHYGAGADARHGQDSSFSARAGSIT
ncbi:MAG: hypothetical protein WHT08_01900 [Bryobacteraceae bacterium]